MARTLKKTRPTSRRSNQRREQTNQLRVQCMQRVSRKSHRGEQINGWSEQSMMNAIQEFNNQSDAAGEYKLTLRGIARAYNVPFETLRRRIKGKISTASGDDVHLHHLGKKTVLPAAAERDLAQHIKDLSSAGFPCTRDDVRNLAYEYATRNKILGFSDKKKKAGYYWFDGFMRRFPELVVKSAENLSVPRAMSMNPTQVSKWFESYDQILQQLGIKDCPNNIWNFDETGCQNIHCANEIVGQVGIPTYNITAMEKGETSTALIGVNAVGVTLPPMIIHRGKYIGKGWSNGAPHDAIVVQGHCDITPNKLQQF